MHCTFCGNTNLKTIPASIFKDPIFVLIHTLLALVLVYSYFGVESESSSITLALTGIVFYSIVLIFFLMNRDGRPQHHCKDCRTVIRTVTDVDVAEYETMPERKRTVQRQGPKRRYLREIIMVSGSVGSVISLILILVPK